MKRQDIYRGLKDRFLDDFEHYCTCWANRRNQWSRAKKADKKIAKKRERRRWKKEAEEERYGKRRYNHT